MFIHRSEREQMTEQKRSWLRRTIHADREGILAFLDEAAKQAKGNTDLPSITRSRRSHYRGYYEGVTFAASAVRDLEPEFNGFPVQVRFAHPGAGYQAAQDNARKAGLVEGQVYTIRTMVVGQSSSHLTLDEIPGHFGTEMFEPVWAHESDADEPEYKVTETDA
jgi:hypothetical protein